MGDQIFKRKATAREFLIVFLPLLVVAMLCIGLGIFSSTDSDPFYQDSYQYYYFEANPVMALFYFFLGGISLIGAGVLLYLFVTDRNSVIISMTDQIISRRDFNRITTKTEWRRITRCEVLPDGRLALYNERNRVIHRISNLDLFDDHQKIVEAIQARIAQKDR